MKRKPMYALFYKGQPIGLERLCKVLDTRFEPDYERDANQIMAYTKRRDVLISFLHYAGHYWPWHKGLAFYCIEGFTIERV